MSDKWKKYFPFKTPRKCQVEAIDFILNKIDSSKYMLLNAPTGAGKSAIAITLSKYFQNEMYKTSMMKSSYIITTQRVLQEQYKKDFPYLANVSAKEHYQCSHRVLGLTCDIGLQIAKITNDTPEYKKYLNTCNYEIERRLFHSSEISITNTFFFMNHADSIEPRKLLIVDEAHSLEEILIDFASMHFTKYYTEETLKLRWPNVKKMKMKHFIEWAENEYKGKLEKDYSSEYGKLTSMNSESYLTSNSGISSMRKVDSLSRLIKNLQMVIDDSKQSQDDWVISVSATEDTVDIKPLYATKYANNLLFKYGQKILLMSGSILDKSIFCRNVGITENEASYLSLDSPFPKENRPIFYIPSGKMSKDNIKETLPNIVTVIEQLLEHHKNEKGIIFTHSYEIASYIDKSIFSTRLLFHSSDDRMDILDFHIKSKEPTVIVTPSLTEGIDLIEDLSRFQILVKCPFPYLGDIYIRTKMNKVENWYAWNTVKSIIQCSGRSIRSEKDTAVTYILDESFGFFFNKNKFMFPDWWTKAIIWD